MQSLVGALRIDFPSRWYLIKMVL